VPFGISEGIAAGGSLLGGIFGKNAADKASKLQAQTAQKVATMAENAATGAQQGVQAAEGGVTNAVNNGQSLVAAASPQSIAAVNNAVTNANQTVNTGVQNANSLLAATNTNEQNNLQPFLAAGTQGVNSLAAALQPGGALTSQFSFNPTDLQNDPGYQFRLKQGLGALQSTAAANGSLQSGNTLAAIENYGQGLAGTEYQNAYNRALTTFQTNRTNNLQSLMSLASFGLPAAAQSNTAFQNYGNLASSNTLNAALYGGTNLTNAGYYTGQNLTGTANTLANMGITGAQLGLQGAEASGQFGLTGAQIAGTALTGGANAQAAGMVGGSNSLWGGIAGAGNALANYSLMKSLNTNNYSLPYSVAPPGPGGYMDMTGADWLTGADLAPAGL